MASQSSKTSSKTKTVNIGLQGGGAHGAFAWGVLDKILEDGRITIESISATSAGAMNATVLAQGLMEGGNEGARQALHDFWRDISAYGKIFSPVQTTPLDELFGLKVENSPGYMLFDWATKMFSPYQFNPYNFNPLRNLLEKRINFRKINAGVMPKLFICATNVKTGKVKIFKNEEVCINAVLASACLPFLFQAIKVGDDYYWDGGYMGNPAIFPLIYNSDSRDVVIIHINPINRNKLPTEANEILNRINEVSFNSSFMREMRAINFVTKLLDNGWIKDEYKDQLKRMYMHSIRADLTMEHFSVASKLNPNWKFLLQLFHFGRSEGEKWLAENFDALGNRSTIDLNEFM